MSSHMTSYCAHTSQEPFLSHSSGMQHHTQTKFHCNHGNLCREHDDKPSGSTNCRQFLGQLKHISCARQLLHCVTAKLNSVVNVFMMFSAAKETDLSFLWSNMLTVTTVPGTGATVHDYVKSQHREVTCEIVDSCSSVATD